MCEHLAETSGFGDTGSYFTSGSFSVLDALLRQPMAIIVGELPFSEDMKAALLDREGRLGEALKCAVSCEQAICEHSDFASLDRIKLRDIYLEAMVWSNENARQLLQ